MMADVSLAALAELLVVYRVSKRRPNTVSLKWELEPWHVATGVTRELLKADYLKYWRIMHSWYRWQIGVSEKGEEVLSGLNVSGLAIDLFEDDNLRSAGTLVLNMSKGELCELLAHPARVLRDWAQGRLEALAERTDGTTVVHERNP